MVIAKWQYWIYLIIQQAICMVKSPFLLLKIYFTQTVHISKDNTFLYENIIGSEVSDITTIIKNFGKFL